MTSAALRLEFDHRLTIRWSILTAALAAEGLALTIGFESPAVTGGEPWWVRLAATAPDLIRIGVASAGILLVLLAPRLRAALQEAYAAAAHYRWQHWCLLQILVFGALYAFLASATRGTAGGTGQISSTGLALCEALAVMAVALWVLALAPLSFWRGFVVRERLALVAAVSAATAAWFAGEVAQSYWKPLASITFTLAERLLRLLYPTIISDPYRLMVGTPRFVVRIAPQCSGYEGIGLVTVFLGVYLWLFRSRIRFPHALLLFPVGIVAVGLANVLRVAGLVAIGSSYSPELAVGGFHSQAGWIAFIALALGMVIATHRMRFFAAVPNLGQAEQINPVAAALMVPFLVLLGTAIVTTALSLNPDRLYPVRILVVAAALLCFWKTYARFDWSWSWPSLGIGAAVFVFWLVATRIIGGEHTALGPTIAAMGQGEAAVWFGFRVIGAILVIPLVEELAFRGYLLRRLTARDFESYAASRFAWLPFVLSSTAFGLLHGMWLAGTMAGLAYALALYRNRKLGDAVAAHITTNALTALFVLNTGTWSLWA